MLEIKVKFPPGHAIKDPRVRGYLEANQSYEAKGKQDVLPSSYVPGLFLSMSTCNLAYLCVVNLYKI